MYFISCDFEIIKIYKSIDARLKTKIYVNFTSFIKPLFDSFFWMDLIEGNLKITCNMHTLTIGIMF